MFGAKKSIFSFLLLIFVFLSFRNQSEKPHEIGIDYNESKFTKPNIPSNNPQTIEGISLGRLLFYDKILSVNNKQSCASCHIQEFAFTDRKKLAIGAKGDINPRNTMSLINLAWGNQFFWDGRVESLEELVVHPINNVLEMDRDTTLLIRDLKEHKYYPELFHRAFPDKKLDMQTLSMAIAQFLRSITGEAKDLLDSMSTSYQINDIELSDEHRLPYEHFSLEPEDLVLTKADTQVYDTYKKQSFSSSKLTEESFSGMYFRLGIMCTPCHTGDSFGGEIMANNLIDKDQSKLFKVPSLINVLHTAPYMRDGRFLSSSEVLDHYDKNISKLHNVNPQLKLSEIPNLITEYDKKNFDKFLEIFTDSSVISNKSYSNPFEEKDFSWENYLKPINQDY